MKNAFLCLLPSNKDSAELLERLNKVFYLPFFPTVKLPLHVTLYYFPKLTKKNNAKMLEWVQETSRKQKGPIAANIRKIMSFKKDKQDFVYYLPLISENINELHQELYEMNKHIHSDNFPFVPHLSLFYPQRDLKEVEKQKIKLLFDSNKPILFDQIALAVEKNRGVHYIDIKTL